MSESKIKKKAIYFTDKELDYVEAISRPALDGVFGANMLPDSGQAVRKLYREAKMRGLR